VYNILTPTLIRVEIASHILLALGVFGSLPSIKEATMEAKLSLFLCNLISLKLFSPLKWWVEHEN
jgi:hypothetical protein